MAVVTVAVPAPAQGIICCNQNIDVGGDWVGSGRIADCQDYFNTAPNDILRRLCQNRRYLNCINTARCSELPPEDTAQQEPANEDAALPPDPDRDGLEQGFYGPPPEPPVAPATPPPMPRRLVYLIKVVASGGTPLTAFTVYLDSTACPVPLGADNRPSEPTAAQHVVRGRIMRSDGHVRIEAEAEDLAGGTKLGPLIGEAEGDDAAAVARATRALAEKMKLVCSR